MNIAFGAWAKSNKENFVKLSVGVRSIKVPHIESWEWVEVIDIIKPPLVLRILVSEPYEVEKIGWKEDGYAAMMIIRSTVSDAIAYISNPRIVVDSEYLYDRTIVTDRPLRSDYKVEQLIELEEK
jgi:hypothetical protein